MTQVTEVIDGYGQIGTRVYATLGDAPSPRLGAFIVVDDGTGGVLYVGLHDSTSTLAWIPWTALLSDAIVQHPAVGQNVINDSNSGENALVAVGDAGISATSQNLVALGALQNGDVPVDPVINLDRTHLTPSLAMGDASPDNETVQHWLNGYAELSIATYSTLPSATADHLGALARLVAGGSGTDTLWACIEVGGTPTWIEVLAGTLSGFVFTNPSPNSVNTITGATGDTDPALTVNVDAGTAVKIHGTGGKTLIVRHSTGDYPQAAYVADSDDLDPASNIFLITEGGSYFWGAINGSGELAVLPYNVLPDPTDFNHLAALASHVNDSGNIDALYFCAQRSDGTPYWAQVWPVNILFRNNPTTPATLQQSTDSGTTYTDTGYTAPDQTGRGILPGPGGHSDIWIDVDFSQGAMLPFPLPLGWTVIVLETYGLWGIQPPTLPLSVSDGINVPIGGTIGTGDRLVATLNGLRLMWAGYDMSGNAQLIGGNQFNDALALLSPADDVLLWLVANQNFATGTAHDGLQCHIRIFGAPVPSGSGHRYSFRALSYSPVWYAAAPVDTSTYPNFGGTEWRNGEFGSSWYAKPATPSGGNVDWVACIETELTDLTNIVLGPGPCLEKLGYCCGVQPINGFGPGRAIYYLAADRSVISVSGGGTSSVGCAEFDSGATASAVKFIQLIVVGQQTTANAASDPLELCISLAQFFDDGSPDGLVGGEDPICP